MFKIEREVVVVFSPYATFFPKTFDAFDAIAAQMATSHKLRVESVCRVLISAASDVEAAVGDLIKADPERPIVVPFTYEELSVDGQRRWAEEEFVLDRFRKYFHERDLFSFRSPLRKDIYFFGRSNLLQEIVNSHDDCEHVGLFGLRKSGKTSIIYAVERHVSTIRKDSVVFVSIDCEQPAVHQLRWWELLDYVVDEYRKAIDSKAKVDRSRYTEKGAAKAFEEDIRKVQTSKKKRTLLMLFDEIEHVSPSTGSSDHWVTGEDFVFFWQTLRGVFQRNQGVYTYVLVGTNPGCVEMVEIEPNGKRLTNPLYGSVHVRYVPAFRTDQVEEMLRKLGGYMGMRFSDELYGMLVKDFGGHPFLIRQFCSAIYQECATQPRPVNVDRALYNRVMLSFSETNAPEYLDMMVRVLETWYRDEYEMLKFLAIGDTATFDQFAVDARLTAHLVSYGIVMKSPHHGYAFSIELLRDYLSRVHRYQRVNLTLEEKRKEMQSRRSNLEVRLRQVVRQAMIAVYGKKAQETVMRGITERRRESLKDTALDELLAKNGSPLYFQELCQIIQKEWEKVFGNIFSATTKTELSVMLTYINRFRSPEAHAGDVTEDEFSQYRLYMKKLEELVENYL